MSSPFAAIRRLKSKATRANRVKAHDITKPLPASKLGGKAAIPGGTATPDPSVPFDDKSLDRDLREAVRKQDDKERSERVEASEQARANRPAVGSGGLSGNQGPIASRARKPVGRSYYSPERLAERSIRRREKLDRARFG